jgi:hypothetical protein
MHFHSEDEERTQRMRPLFPAAFSGLFIDEDPRESLQEYARIISDEDLRFYILAYEYHWTDDTVFRDDFEVPDMEDAFKVVICLRLTNATQGVTKYLHLDLVCKRLYSFSEWRQSHQG